MQIFNIQIPKKDDSIMMEFSRQSLSTGWSFRDRDADEWMPVASVPSVVQQDLIANNK
jgi:beta-mannosidase